MTRLAGSARALAGDSQNLRMARSIAARFAATAGIHPDDAESAAAEALCEAALSFDPGRGVRFADYASPRILGFVIDDARRWSRSRVKGPKVVAAADAERPEAACRRRPEDDVDSSDRFDSLVSALPPRHRQIIRLIYQGHFLSPQSAVAAALGVTQPAISQGHTAAIAMIRAALAARGIHTRADLDGGPA